MAKTEREELDRSPPAFRRRHSHRCPRHRSCQYLHSSNLTYLSTISENEDVVAKKIGE